MTSEASQPRDEPKSPAGETTVRAGYETADSLRLQPRLMPRADGLYYVSEILAYHDEAFVDAAYAAVLRRQPSDEEFRGALADLRGGAREKIDILRDLASSAEGRSQSAFERIAGLRRSRLAGFARSLPVVGHLWQVLAALIRLPVALSHQRRFEAYALAQQQLIADHLNTQRRRIADQLDAQERRIADELSAQRQLVVDQLGAQERRVAERLDAERRHHDEATEHLAARLREVIGEMRQGADELRQAIAEASAAVSLLSDAMSEIYARQTEHQSQLNRRLDAQQEFLVREQQAIVEAQKAALADAEAELSAAASAGRRELAALSARLDELLESIGAARGPAGGKV